MTDPRITAFLLRAILYLKWTTLSVIVPGNHSAL